MVVSTFTAIAVVGSLIAFVWARHKADTNGLIFWGVLFLINALVVFMERIE